MNVLELWSGRGVVMATNCSESLQRLSPGRTREVGERQRVTSERAGARQALHMCL
jgi:hypothetical protein